MDVDTDGGTSLNPSHCKVYARLHAKLPPCIFDSLTHRPVPRRWAALRAALRILRPGPLRPTAARGACNHLDPFRFDRRRSADAAPDAGEILFDSAAPDAAALSDTACEGGGTSGPMHRGK